MKQCRSCEIYKSSDEFSKNQNWCKDCAKTNKLKTRYNLSDEDIIELYNREECEICGDEFDDSSKIKKRCVDHDHKTGKVRGFICHYCNFVLGAVKDDENTLRALISYLNGNTGRTS